jgi:hypothetical protein
MFTARFSRIDLSVGYEPQNYVSSPNKAFLNRIYWDGLVSGVYIAVVIWRVLSSD